MVAWGCGGRLLRKVVWPRVPPAQWTSAKTYYTIQAVPREYSGCRVAAKERAMGRIPAVVLTQGEGGEGRPSIKQLLTASEEQIETLLKRVPFFCSSTFLLQVRAGSGSSVVMKSGTVLPIKVHKHVETGKVLNLVLAWAEQGSELKVDVPIVFQGEDNCPGLQKGGYLQKIRKSLRYLCPSEHIPPKIEVDVTKLDIGDKVFMRDVEVHSSLKLLSKDDSIPICMIKVTKTERPEPQVEAKVPKTSVATEA